MSVPALHTALLKAWSVSVSCILAVAVCAQDPSCDYPEKRVQGVTAEQAYQLGVARLQKGWHWEAARMFRELMVVDDAKPLPHLLMALAMRDVPNRAARHCYDALARREHGGASEQQVLHAYQAYFGVTDQPELSDARFQKAPGEERSKALLEALVTIAQDAAAAGLARDLAAIERLELQVAKAPLSVPPGACAGEHNEPVEQALLNHHNAFLNNSQQMPFMVPGYRMLAKKGVSLSPGQRLLARIPRHPHHQVMHRMGAALPGFPYQSTPGPISWQPQEAPGFDLPRGIGGRGKFADYRNRPVLVVFFLGFGCAHCVAQLADLDPKAPKFREAGIEVITIGTDDLNQVRAARQAADENGIDPLHFDVLCDPKGHVFKQWGAWDEFSDEALHGSFLVDALGRILWQDVSVRPFEESEWLLGESKRLLTAWQ